MVSSITVSAASGRRVIDTLSYSSQVSCVFFMLCTADDLTFIGVTDILFHVCI